MDAHGYRFHANKCNTCRLLIAAVMHCSLLSRKEYCRTEVFTASLYLSTEFVAQQTDSPTEV